MTEQEVKTALIKLGYKEEEADSLIWTHHKMKKDIPELTFEGLIDDAKRIYEKHKDDTDDFITVD